MFTRENLLRTEVFPAELPPCFGTSTLASCVNEVIGVANASNQTYSIPLKYRYSYYIPYTHSSQQKLKAKPA